MDCFGTCFTHAQTSDVKPPCKRPRSPLQRWRQPLSSPLQALLKPLQAPFKPPSPSEGFKPPSTFRPSSPPPSPSDPSSPLEGGFWRGYLGTSPPQLSKYRSKVSILSPLALMFRFAAEETIFWLPTVVKSSNCCLVQTFSLPNILSSFYWMKFANLVVVSSIQRTQTGGLLSLLSFFPCRGLYISFWSLVRPCLRLTDFYCLILSRLLANMQLRLDTLSSSHNYFCGNTKIDCFLRADWFFWAWRFQHVRARELIRFVSRWSITRYIFKKYQLWRPPKRGSFSCRKPVSHVGTSTVP